MHNNNYGHSPYGQPGHNAGYPGPGYPQNQGNPTHHSLYPNLPAQNMAYPNAPGYPNPSYPQGNPGWQPTVSLAYPGAASAPPASQFLPTVSPTPVLPAPFPGIHWVPTTPRDAQYLENQAVVAGYEAHDGSPIWVIRARFQGDMIPGKMPVKHRVAYVPWGGNENWVNDIEVLCAPPDKIRWMHSGAGVIPPNMIPGGETSDGEPLFIGRATEQGSLTPGKVHPSHGVLYISFGGKEIPHKKFEILCQC